MRDSPVPPWRQILTIIKNKIETGELPSGSRLPSIRGLSQEYGVAMTTAQKVLEALRDEQLVVTSPMGRRQPESRSRGECELPGSSPRAFATILPAGQGARKFQRGIEHE